MKCFRPGEVDYRLQTGRFGGFEAAFREGTADEKVIAHSFDNDIFFSQVREIEPGKDGVVIDIGAHIGTFALLAAKKAPLGRVHAFEASRETFNYLKINAALNPSLPITVHHMAVAGERGEVMLHHDLNGNWGHSITRKMSARGEIVPAITLDAFVADNDLRAVSVVKFNCEGAEFPILMGCEDETLRRVRAMLVLYHLHLVDGYSLHALTQRLTDAGFTIRVIKHSASKGWIIASR